MGATGAETLRYAVYVVLEARVRLNPGPGFLRAVRWLLVCVPERLYFAKPSMYYVTATTRVSTSSTTPSNKYPHAEHTVLQHSWIFLYKLHWCELGELCMSSHTKHMLTDLVGTQIDGLIH